MKASIESAIADVKGALESGDAEAINSKSQALAQVAMKLGEAMYAAQQGSGDAGDAQPADDGVVDAEFEEVSDSDDKKSA